MYHRGSLDRGGVGGGENGVASECTVRSSALSTECFHNFTLHSMWDVLRHYICDTLSSGASKTGST